MKSRLIPKIPFVLQGQLQPKGGDVDSSPSYLLLKGDSVASKEKITAADRDHRAHYSLINQSKNTPKSLCKTSY